MHPTLLAIGCSALSVAILILRDGTAPAIPFSQWSYALPAVAMGVVFAACQDQKPVVLGCSAGVVLAMILAGWPAGSFQQALAIGAMLVCGLVVLPSTPGTTRGADLSLTVYLAHPLVASLLLRVTPLPEGSISLLLATLAGSFLLAWALQRRPRPRTV
jgi:peptidoglycan/LPS O-acetylase OafA/YrhL